MKTETCAFTGHRPHKFPWKDNEADPRCMALKETLEEQIAILAGAGVTEYFTGGADGVDTLAAQTVLKLREEYPHIRLILVLPCRTQTRGWPDEDVRVYEAIKSAADKIRYTSEEYTRGCMHKRNRHLVDNSSICVSYMTKNTGSTAYTVDYARKKHVRIINLPEL